MRAIAAVFAADVATFALAILVFRIPISAESNPTMVAAYLAAGVAGVAAWKASLFVVTWIAIHRIRTRPRRVAILIAYALALLGPAANIAALFR